MNFCQFNSKIMSEKEYERLRNPLGTNLRGTQSSTMIVWHLLLDENVLDMKMCCVRKSCVLWVFDKVSMRIKMEMMYIKIWYCK